MSGTAKPMLDEPRAGRLTIRYAPEADTEIAENPPRFTWLPVIEDEANYVLRVTATSGEKEGETLRFGPLRYNMFTPDAPLAAGDYTWAYAVCDADGNEASEWSSARSFTIGSDLPEAAVSGHASRFAATSKAHPHLWLTPDRLEDFRESVAADPSHCGWNTFYERSVLPWMEREIIPEPAGYPDHKRVAHVWRQTYIDCQELLYAIRHLAIGGEVTGDAAMTRRAVEWLLSAAAWNPSGTTSRAYTDEWAFRVNIALAWGYDWLHDDLTDEERDTVREALLTRTRETADHIIKHARIHLFPYDSHAVRAVSLVLVPASIALLHDAPEAEDWLHYSVDFLSTVYSPWGDSDGGWAEGTNYWMMGLAYLIDAANQLKSYTGIDIYKRQFFQKTGDFALYAKAPNTRRASFGDDSTQGDLPCVKTGYNLRQFAGITGNGAYQWYFEELNKLNPGTEGAFYNWGWWDFNFDELVYRTDNPVIEATPPESGMRHFKGIGWIGIQHRMAEPDQHVQFVFKSSPFGSISHSHGDQNAFCMAAFGEDLAIQSGHYVAFNSTMHRNWRRQTKSKNAILIDGKGQYAGRDKAQAMQSTGRIITAEERDDHIYIHGDATAAYRTLTPEVTKAEREVYFVNNEYFVIVDSVDADTPVSVEWLLHANDPMTLGQTTFRYAGSRAGFYGEVLWSEAGAPKLSQDTGFPDVEPSEIEGLPVSTCLTVAYPKAVRHRIATLLVPYPLESPRRIFSFLDDQGYDCELYFDDADGSSFKVVVPKTFNVGAPAGDQEKKRKEKQ